MTYSIDDIKRGLDRGEFVFHFQPKVDFLTGRVSGAEALIRWRRGGEDRWLQPEEFMHVAEAHGLMPEVTQRTFPRFVQDFRAILAADPGTSVSFNLTAEELDSPALLRMVREQVDKGGILAGKLEIEITEGSRVSDSDEVREAIRDLIASGVRFSMDDYGTGFSSLETLNRLPFAAIKLDQGFVMKMLSSSKSATLVKTSIAAAQMLGIGTVVEGIESRSVYHSLMHSGCTEGQGYWISPPLPLEAYLDFLGAGRSWPCSPIGMLRMAQITHTWQYKLLVDMVCSLVEHKETDLSALQTMHIDHYGCSLGRWYYGVGQEFSTDSDYQALEAPHRAMHATCEMMADALIRPRPEMRLRQLLQQLSENSIRVSNALERLETRLLIKEVCRRS